jgi:hypothetical protein
MLALLALLPVSLASAEDYADIVNRAFAAINNDFHATWAFTEAETEDGITHVGRYDPSRPAGERWSLISVDGRKPSSEQVEDYLDDKHEFEFSEDDDDDIEIIDFDTLELIEETDDYWIFRFVPNGEDEEDEKAREFMRQVNGTVKVVRDGHYLEYLDMYNEKPIKPAFSVKISRFVTRLTFGPAVDGGPIVPKTVDVQVKGRAALLIRFDESESTHYSDYEYVGG